MDTHQSQSGFALVPLLAITATVLVAGLTIGSGIYVLNRKSTAVEDLSREVQALKEQAQATPTEQPSPSPLPDLTETSSPSPLPTATQQPKPAVQAAVTQAPKKPEPTPIPNHDPPVATKPIPTAAEAVDTDAARQKRCEQEALAAKSKYVIELESIKSKYQSEFDNKYNYLVAIGEYEQAKLFQQGWQAQIENINNSMSHAYDIALSNCMAK